ncbi:MAG TPA: SCO family protein [Devosia sp.]
MTAVSVALLSLPASAAVERPEFAPTIGASVAAATELTDDAGQSRTLGQWLEGKPAVVIFGYHNCPNLCGVVQQTVARALGATGLAPASHQTLFISLAPVEGPTDAAAAKVRLAEAVGDATAAPWRFLSGTDVVPLAESFGLGAIERERIRQYVHPVALFTLTPSAHISHVLPGLEIGAGDLRLAIVDASAGRIGTLFDRIILFCAGFDPTKGQHTPFVLSALRTAAIATLIVTLLAIGWLRLRERRQ